MTPCYSRTALVRLISGSALISDLYKRLVTYICKDACHDKKRSIASPNHVILHSMTASSDNTVFAFHFSFDALNLQMMDDNYKTMLLFFDIRLDLKHVELARQV